MCDICDGMTYEESYERTRRLIEDERWWTLEAVEGSGDSLSWTYTIGITQLLGHPELVVVGLDHEEAGRLLNQLGERIRAGAVLGPGPETDRVAGLTFGPVAGEQWTQRSTFAGWHGYYDWRGAPRPERSAVQVFVHAWPVTTRVVLGDPTADVHGTGLPRPNRAHRRRQQRRR